MNTDFLNFVFGALSVVLTIAHLQVLASSACLFLHGAQWNSKR